MRFFCLLMVLVPGLCLADATTVYRTVGEDGVVQFSDQPPADAPAETLHINTPAPAADGQYQQNLEAMRETTDRMAAERRAREVHRAELREIAQRAQPEPAPQVQVYERYLPAVGYYPPHYRPRPPHYRPGQPPLRPRPQPLPANERPTEHNSQLMRPITSR